VQQQVLVDLAGARARKKQAFIREQLRKNMVQVVCSQRPPRGYECPGCLLCGRVRACVRSKKRVRKGIGGSVFHPGPQLSNT